MDEIQIEAPQQDTLQEVPITEITSSNEITKNQTNGPSGNTLPHCHDIPVEFVANFNTIKCAFSDNSTKLNNEQVQKQLTQVFLDCCEIHSYAHEYDYSPSVKYNGFRSFFKMVSDYLDQLSLLVRLLKSGIATKKEKKLVTRINKYINFLPLLAHQLHSLKLIRKQKFLKDEEDNDSNKKDEYPKEVKEIEKLDKTIPLELEILFHQMKLTEKEMEPFFDYTTYGFWLPKSVVNTFKSTNAFTISFIFYPWYQGIVAYFNKKKLAVLSADRSINSAAAEVKKEQKFLEWIISSKSPADATVTEYMLKKRQNRYLIDKKSLMFEHNLVNSICKHNNQEPIKLVIVKPKCRRNDNVIFHIHGGAWCLLSPKAYFNVLNRWVKEIGSTIISVDYSLAPAQKYPVALQEILDTYSWLTDSVVLKQPLEPLGFIPKDILVTGDSAGGNFTMSLAIVLAEIKRVFPEPGQSLPLPKAFAPLYPAASPGLPFTSASSVLLDVVLSMSLRTKFCPMYYLDDPIDMATSYLGGKNGKPWFKEETKVKDVYIRVNGDKKGDPIFHILTYESFDILKDVPLYIQAAEFDPLLDDAVEIAKAWKGPVTFDVLPNVMHGFTLFIDDSIECEKADKLVTQRMKEALEK